MAEYGEDGLSGFLSNLFYIYEKNHRIIKNICIDCENILIKLIIALQLSCLLF